MLTSVALAKVYIMSPKSLRSFMPGDTSLFINKRPGCTVCYLSQSRHRDCFTIIVLWKTKR